MNSLDQITRTLGEPKALWIIQSGSRTVAAIARWRHRGATIDLSDADAFQVVFNLSGGQVVDFLQRGGMQRTIRAGSVGINSPEHLGRVNVLGRADTLQILISREWIETVNGGSALVGLPQLATCEPQLRAAAAQALVALEQRPRDSQSRLEKIARAVARRFVTPAALPAKTTTGGLSPASRRRVGSLISECVADFSRPSPQVDQMAKAAGLSIYHFTRAFHRSEGQTPHACLIGRCLDLALVLLLKPEARIDQVSDETGFSSASHFVSTFKRYLGMTPGAFRDAARSWS